MKKKYTTLFLAIVISITCNFIVHAEPQDKQDVSNSVTISEAEAKHIAIDYANKHNNLEYRFASIKLEEQKWIVWVKAVRYYEAMKITVDAVSGKVIDVFSTE